MRYTCDAFKLVADAQLEFTTTQYQQSRHSGAEPFHTTVPVPRLVRTQAYCSRGLCKVTTSICGLKLQGDLDEHNSRFNSLHKIMI